MVASPTNTRAHGTSAGSGRVNHRSAEATTQSRVKTAIQGLRRPPLSAMAPKTGPITATTKAAMLMVYPHWLVPVISSAATALVK